MEHILKKIETVETLRVQDPNVIGRFHRAVQRTQLKTIKAMKELGEPVPTKESKVLLACSGGVDSMALMMYLYLEGYENVGVFTLDHSLRPESWFELRMVESWVRRLGFAFYGRKADIGALAKEHKESVEMMGRKVRYEYLDSIFEEEQYDYMVTAHHRDDQVESVLAHLLKGADITGLQGMRVVEGHIWRPFLGITKKAIRQYAESMTLEHAEDMSNYDLVYERNRIRHQLLPVLEKFNDRVKESLIRLSEAAVRDELYFQDIVEDVTEEYWRPIGSTEEHETWRDAVEWCLKGEIQCCPWHKSQLASLDDAILTRVWRTILHEFLPEKRIAQTHIEQLVALTRGGVGKKFLLGQVQVSTTYDTIKIGLQECYYPETSKMRELQDKSILVRQADPLVLGSRLEEIDDVVQYMEEAPPYTYCIPAGLVTGNLQIRNRQSGDKIAILDRMHHVHGHKRLKEWLIDRKIDRSQRDDLKWLVDEGGSVFGMIDEKQLVYIDNGPGSYYVGSFEEGI